MRARKVSETEEDRLPRQPRRVMSIDEFCERYGPGRRTAYAELKSGRLRGRKIRRRTVITEDDAEDWLRRLPAVSASEALA